MAPTGLIFGVRDFMKIGQGTQNLVTVRQKKLNAMPEDLNVFP
jgi:hypothetical protein